jgi:hypothetical protein
MSDPTPILQMLGLNDPPADDTPVDPVADPAPDAAAPDATSADASETQSLDEALAELEGTDAPSVESESEPTEDAQAPATALTPDEIAAILAENEAYKAKEAEVSAQSEEQEWHGMWDDHMDDWKGLYQNLRGIVRHYGTQQGMSEREIRGLIHEVVEEGIGIENINKLTPGQVTVPPGMLGYKEWLEVTTENRRLQTDQWRSTRNQPDALDQMASKYALTTEQRTSLAKFRNYPPDAFEEIARTLGLNNQRVTSTLSDATKQASRNLAQNLSNGLAPGAGGASAAKKPYEFKHTPDVRRQETEYVAQRLGLVRRAS